MEKPRFVRVWVREGARYADNWNVLDMFHVFTNMIEYEYGINGILFYYLCCLKYLLEQSRRNKNGHIQKKELRHSLTTLTITSMGQH